MADMPPEVHHMIMDVLDAIDSTCLALVNRYFYQLHRRRNGSVSLSTVRQGPNDQEWAWRSAGQLIHPLPSPSISSRGARNKTDAFPSHVSPHGLFWCRMCGFSRCELQRHIKEWMPRGLEYCPVSGKYVPLIVDGNDIACYKRSPNNHRVCGKHVGRGRLLSGRSHKSEAVSHASTSGETAAVVV
ncbi:F-box domain-containing protein [Colletotrichum tofieldiae]|uniref:F-box domain-containing protein n=1 Tax=Colletotrichum tofieldiae TaxID=708197 RepID=A0A166TY48_9PEZI|nr:F-box domain-containing protein [Colletotrichum tofieldiae]